MEEKKNIEVVSGDGSNLEISPVYDHLNVSTPKSAEKKPKYVVIPEEKKKKDQNPQAYIFVLVEVSVRLMTMRYYV